VEAERGHRGRALQVRLLGRGARGVGAKGGRAPGAGPRDARANEQLLPRLRGEERPAVRDAARRRPRAGRVNASGDPQFCYVTTIGRVTGRPHQIEIWFAREPGARTIYLLSGGRDRSDWVKNIRADAAVIVRIGD